MLMEWFRLTDRANDRVETLSGGLARRADLAKALLHRPKVLLLDEPSTGLDPRVRWELWKYLDRCRRDENLTVLMTTHFMDEADRCDRVAIIDAGRIVALGSPDQLKLQIAGECLTIKSADPAALAGLISARFGLHPLVLDGRVRIEQPGAHELIPRLMTSFPSLMRRFH
jgi:ABC-2 type transport system ATP-binding protein